MHPISAGNSVQDAQNSEIQQMAAADKLATLIMRANSSGKSNNTLNQLKFQYQAAGG